MSQFHLTPVPLLFPDTARYECVRPLGKGGMGAVFLVSDHLTGAQVAMKVMLHQTAERLLRFKQEFRTVAELHHPHLVQLLELQWDGTHWFFTMEYVEGENPLALLGGEESGSLGAELTGSATLDGGEFVGREPVQGFDGRGESERVLSSPCDLDAFRVIASQLLLALSHLHDHGIVHRDLKPSNILVDLNGCLKLLDFGIASYLAVESASQSESQLAGTLAYMAPELLRGGEATPASDLYALGCVMFELLTGARPYPGKSAEITWAKLAGEVPRVSAYVEGVPGALDAICAALMAPQPEERPSLAEVRSALGWEPSVLPMPDWGGSFFHWQQHPFVGREAELSRLSDGLDQALAGELQMMFVTGESGIGKSALAARFLSQARRRGVLCLEGRCYERELLPFVAWDRLMDQLALALQGWPEALLEPLRGPLEAVEESFPVVGLLLGKERAIRASLSSPERMARSFEQFCELLMFCQVQVPLLLVLDDLQWTDLESLALLEKVLDNCKGRIFLLGLSRTEGVDEAHPLHALYERVRADAPEGHIALQAMTRETCLALLAKVGGQTRFTDGQLEAILEQARGSPLLALQLIDYLAALGGEERSRYLQTRANADNVIMGLIRRLSGPAEELLALLATAGSRLPYHTLEASFEGPPELLDKHLNELRSARMIKWVQQGAHRRDGKRSQEVDIYHDQIREVLYRQLPAGRKSRLHRRCALALEGEEERDGRHAEALRRHWGAVGETEKRHYFTKKAADFAASKCAFRKAAALLEEVLTSPNGHESQRQRAVLWERLGDYCEWVSANDAAARAFQQSLALWRQQPHDPNDQRYCAELRLLGALARNHLAEGCLREVRDSLKEGLALSSRVPGRHPLQRSGRLVGLLGEALSTVGALSSGTPNTPTPWDRARFQFLARALPFLALWPGDLLEAQLHYKILSHKLGDAESVFRSALSKAFIQVFFGGVGKQQVPASRLGIERAEQIAKQEGLVGAEDIVRVYRALSYLPTDLARVRREMDAALRGLVKHGLGDGLDANVARLLSMIAMYFQGQYQALVLFSEAERGRAGAHFPNRLWATVFQLIALARLGRREEATALLAELEVFFDDEVPFAFSSLRWAAHSALSRERGLDVIALREASTLGWSHHLLPSLANVLWLEFLVDAACVVCMRGELSALPLRKVKWWAHFLTRHRSQPFQCLGHRALAVLHYHAGKEKAAQLAMQRALAISSEVDARYCRWVCLKTACALGMGDETLASEAAQLQAREGYAAL